MRCRHCVTPTVTGTLITAPKWTAGRKGEVLGAGKREESMGLSGTLRLSIKLSLFA